MATKAIGFVGIRTDRLDAMVELCRDLLGMAVAHETSDFVGFKLRDGTVLELYGPAETFHGFFTTGPVVGFRVDDFDATRGAMLAAGISFIGEPQHADGQGWQHFYCPDGTVAEIIGPGAAPPSS